jgi:hypothetical protein
MQMDGKKALHSMFRALPVRSPQLSENPDQGIPSRKGMLRRTPESDGRSVHELFQGSSVRWREPLPTAHRS